MNSQSTATRISQTVYQDSTHAGARDWWQAAKRGFGQRCPSCGEGKIFFKYLKTCDACDNCGEELHHHRADDAPPYVTILIVGHILGAIMLAMHERNVNLSIWTEAILYPVVGLLVALWFLPRIKGALIGYQWALRMHDFEKPDTKKVQDI